MGLIKYNQCILGIISLVTKPRTQPPHLDYCNGFLPGQPGHTLSIHTCPHFQPPAPAMLIISSQPSRKMTFKSKSNHITLLFKTLQCLASLSA